MVETLRMEARGKPIAEDGVRAPARQQCRQGIAIFCDDFLGNTNRVSLTDNDADACRDTTDKAGVRSILRPDPILPTVQARFA